MDTPFSLQGKTILVTGASSGIGRATAVECSRMGANIIGTARSEERLQTTLSLLEKRGKHRMIAQALEQEDSVEQLLKNLGKEPVHGVVHCAGITGKSPLPFIKECDLETVIRTNLQIPLLLNKHLLKTKLLQKGASIVFLSSIAAMTPRIGLTAYAASKGGLISAMKVAANELKSKGIRANAICPAMVETEMTDIKALGISDEQKAADQKRYILNRYAKAEEVAQMIVFLLSDAAAWVTGSVYTIDGGRNL